MMSEGQMQRSDGKRALVVDDDDSSRIVMAALLKREGYHVRTVEDGSTALEVLHSEPIDILLVDFYMPGMNGLEVAMEVRKANLCVPIILVTAKAYMLDNEAVEQAGVNQILPKPFTREKIRSYLNKFRSREEH